MTPSRSLLATFCLIVGATGAAGADDVVDRAGLIPDGARLEELWNEGEFTEGVAVDRQGIVYFSDIARTPEKAGRVLRFDPATKRTTVYCADSRKSNGLFFAPDGKLIAACGANNGARAICEITPDGQVQPLVERFEGKRFNAPNDLVILADGTLYFSDPRYVGPEPLELDHMSVYRVSPDRETVVRVTTDVEKPNGVHVSPDGKTLYVAETNNGSTDVTKDDAGTKKGRMTLNAFARHDDGSLGEKRVLFDFGDQTGVDGMTIDETGRIYAAVRSEKPSPKAMHPGFGIVVFAPDGDELAYVSTPKLPTNCCLGRGDEAHVLYITAGEGLYRFPFDKEKVRGFHPN